MLEEPAKKAWTAREDTLAQHEEAGSQGLVQLNHEGEDDIQEDDQRGRDVEEANEV